MLNFVLKSWRVLLDFAKQTYKTLVGSDSEGKEKTPLKLKITKLKGPSSRVVGVAIAFPTTQDEPLATAGKIKTLRRKLDQGLEAKFGRESPTTKVSPDSQQQRSSRLTDGSAKDA